MSDQKKKTPIANEDKISYLQAMDYMVRHDMKEVSMADTFLGARLVKQGTVVEMGCSAETIHRLQQENGLTPILFIVDVPTLNKIVEEVTPKKYKKLI